MWSASGTARFTATALLAFCTTANAQLFRAYLASTGSDGNPCTLPAPCRLLPAALNAVGSGGEIWMLDSANYNTGTVTIGKSVSILAVPGAVGSVVATGGPAVSIPASGLTVALRNLVIAPVLSLPPGTDGVHMSGASTLTVENSLLANLQGAGILVDGTSGAGTLKVSSTTLRNNNGEAIRLLNGATASITNTQMLANLGGGIRTESLTAVTTTATVTRSLISGGDAGAFAYADVTGSVARVSITHSTIEQANFAILSATNNVGTAEVTVGNSLIVDNTYAWSRDGVGSSVLSLDNNQMSGNLSSFGNKSSLAPR